MSRYRKLTDINENQAIFRGIIQAYLLKITCKIVDSVKNLGKPTLEILTVSLWKKFNWGLTYFDQFSFVVVRVKHTMNSCLKLVLVEKMRMMVGAEQSI